MKQYILYLLTAAFLLGACSQEEVPYYSSNQDGVYFDYENQDELSQEVNFAQHLLDDVQELPVTLKLKLVGYPTDQPRKIVIGTDSLADYKLAQVTVPEVVFEAGEYEKNITVQVKRPEEQGEQYAVRLFVDAENEASQLGSGIEGYEGFNIFVNETYTKPSQWDQYSMAQMYFGDWTQEKYVLLAKLTGQIDFYKSYDYASYISWNEKAVQQLRQEHADTGEPVTIEIPFNNECQYTKPPYWNSTMDKYLGAYSSKTFATICNNNGLTTASEEVFFQKDENGLKQLNGQLVGSMMSQYNDYFNWGFLTAPDYKSYFYVPVLVDNIDNIQIVEPAFWTAPPANSLITPYYGEYSEAKYRFMLKVWAEKKGNDFQLMQLFPVKAAYGESGMEASWDNSPGFDGESGIASCLKAFKEEYDKNPGSYDFSFPDR